MAGDATIQGAIAGLLRALAMFADEDVTVNGDFRALGRRTGEQVIIYPGPVEAVRDAGYSEVKSVWTHYVEVWTDFQGDDLSGLSTARQAVLDQIAAYPTLDGTLGIVNCMAVASSDVLWLYAKGAGPDSQPVKAGFRLTVQTTEVVVYSGSGEYA